MSVIPTPSVDPSDLSRLHARLVTAADRDGLLDLAYRSVDTPVGRLLLVATDVGLVRVAYPREDHDAVLAMLESVITRGFLPLRRSGIRSAVSAKCPR